MSSDLHMCAKAHAHTLNIHKYMFCFFKKNVVLHPSSEGLWKTRPPQKFQIHSTLLPFQIIAAQEEMLKKERELEEARKKLAQIRQQQYKFLPTELREDEG